MKQQDKQHLIKFLKELKLLMNKYGVNISAGCSDCSDLHGVYGEYMAISFVDWTRTSEEIKISEGWEFDASDIKETLENIKQE